MSLSQINSISQRSNEFEIGDGKAKKNYSTKTFYTL